MSKRAFGELESQILYILKSGERKTVKEVHRVLGGKDNYNTVMTVMSRLATKKLLGREKKGLQYEYWPLSATQSPSFLDKLKQKLLVVRPTALLSYLVESEDLTNEDLNEMEKIIKQAKAAKK